ncbi:MAG: DUF2332 domain-containing protein [Minwuia sp.]|uniref:DUF2332 domain-containing protein n=1 Tax=Minwuia sp. TaxID=2493630 RepID=UPI003A8A265B
MGDQVRKNFKMQGRVCGEMGSDFTRRLLRMAGDRLQPESAAARRILDWPEDRVLDDAPALRFAGGLHALALSGRDSGLAGYWPPNNPPEDDDALWSAVERALSAHDEFLDEFFQHPPQTNETARAACLLLGFQEAARETGLPLHMLEIGASAGLNQNWDRFRYNLGGAVWGPKDSPVQLTPEWRGAAPELIEVPKAATAACDLNPLRVTDPEQALRLRSYVWPDQQARMTRLDGAIRIAQEEGVSLARANAADWLVSTLALRPGARTTVVFHSIFWQYLPAEHQRTIRSAIEVAGDLADDRAPLCWVRMEPYEEDRHKAAVYYTHWPDPERRVLALCDYHGRWIEPQ